MPDIIVIGGGPGGTAAATRAAQLGAQVTVIERAHLGGNCVNNNCIPMTSLLASVELYRRIGQAGDMGIRVGAVSLDVPGMIARKDRIVQDLREGITGLLPTFGIEIVQGQARLADVKTVEVNGQRLQAARAVILATGHSGRRCRPVWRMSCGPMRRLSSTRCRAGCSSGAEVRLTSSLPPCMPRWAAR